MKRLPILAITLVALFSILMSCNRNDSTHCQFLSPAFILVDYTEDERDTIILRRYEKDNSFSNLIDTTILSKAEIKYTVIGQDSIVITSTNPEYRLFNEELFANDWEINIPAVNRTSRISEVMGSFEKKRDTDEQCRSFVTSMRYEGSVRNYTTWLSDSYRFYFTK